MPGRQHEHLHRDVRRAVEAGGAEDDLAGPLLGVLDEVLERLPRRVGADHQHGRVGIDARDAGELIARVVRRAPEELVDLGQDGDADEGHEQRVAVGLAASPTIWLPTAPAAPGLLTTTTGCFRMRSSAAATGRAVLSARPPGGNATTIETGRVGYAIVPCATPRAIATTSTAPASARIIPISFAARNGAD